MPGVGAETAHKKGPNDVGWHGADLDKYQVENTAHKVDKIKWIPGVAQGYRMWKIMGGAGWVLP